MSVYKRKNNEWYCRFQINGERKHYKCSGAQNKTEALKIENGFKYKLQQQQNGIMPKEEIKISFKSLCDSFLEYSRVNKKSYKQDKSRVASIKEFFINTKYIQNIKPNNIEKFKIFLLSKGLSKTTVNRYLEILSKMFNMAIMNEWIEKNPVKRHMKFPLKNYVIRYLKDEEDDLFLKVLPEHFFPIYITALNSGLRKSNIRLLKWENINLDFRLIELTENKGNKHIKLYINDTLYDLFSQMSKQKHPSGFLFINPRTNRFYSDEAMRDEWNSIKEKAGVKDFRFHDLRHTVGTRLAEKGVPVPVIKEILTHSDIRTTMGYVHASSNQIKSAMNVLGSYN